MTPDLADLRAELDRIDDALHDLIMRRAAVVQQVAACKTGPTQLRPGREAAILRRLLQRHAGALPPTTVLRIWRELLAGAVMLQGPFVIAVGGSSFSLVQAAREQFGALTPLHHYTEPAFALGAVRSGRAAVAVLALPEGGEANPWWPSLIEGVPRLHVVARLPFWVARPDGAPVAQALAVATAPPDSSGDDRSLVALALRPGIGSDQLVAELRRAGFDADAMIVHEAWALADLAGFVTDADPRWAGLSGMCAAPIMLGAYACPIATEPLP